MTTARELGELPAYPTDNEQRVGPNTYHFTGMTIRQQFAMAAMQGLLSSETTEFLYNVEAVVQRAVQRADALLAELVKAQQ